MIYKTSHRKQWSTKHHTENNDHCCFLLVIVPSVHLWFTASDYPLVTLKFSYANNRLKIVEPHQKHHTENNDLQNITQKTMIYKTSHRKQWSTKHYTENNDLQNITQKTTIYKTSHRKQRSTKHYTENNDLQNITQKTTIYKTLHRKQRSTKHYRENNDLQNCRSLFSVWCFVDRCFLCDVL
jgi:hypothetical protein